MAAAVGDFLLTLLGLPAACRQGDAKHGIARGGGHHLKKGRTQGGSEPPRVSQGGEGAVERAEGGEGGGPAESVGGKGSGWRTVSRVGQ